MSTLKKAVSTITTAMQTWTDGIADLRQQISNKTRTRAAIDGAPLPLSEVLPSRLRKCIDQTAQIWLDQHGNSFVHSDQDRGLMTASPKADLELPHVVSVWSPLPWGFLCAADPDFAEQLVTKLLTKLAYEPGLPLAERTAIMAKLDKELAAIETEENALVDEAIAAGLGITHRPEVLQRREEAETRRRQQAYNERRRRELDAETEQQQAARPGSVRNTQRSTTVGGY